MRRTTMAYWVVLSYLPMWAVRLVPMRWRHRQVRRFMDDVMRKGPGA